MLKIWTRVFQLNLALTAVGRPRRFRVPGPGHPSAAGVGLGMRRAGVASRTWREGTPSMRGGNLISCAQVAFCHGAEQSPITTLQKAWSKRYAMPVCEKMSGGTRIPVHRKETSTLGRSPPDREQLRSGVDLPIVEERMSPEAMSSVSPLYGRRSREVWETLWQDPWASLLSGLRILPRPLGQVTRPLVHQDTPAFEQARASIGCLDPVPDHMCQGRLDHLPGMVRLQTFGEYWSRSCSPQTRG